MTTIGIVGGGQLGRMMALAGYPLGLRFKFIDPAPDSPASQVAPCIQAEYDDPNGIERFADGVDVITYEFENIPVATLDRLQERAPIYPPRAALATSQDRLIEKQFFQSLQIDTPRFAAVDSLDDLIATAKAIGLPAILKTRRFGYDGKGQATIRSASEIDAAWNAMQGGPSILEAMIEFDEEVSIVAARSVSGETAFYPLAHNTHEGGILRVSWVDPSTDDKRVQSAAVDAATRVLEALEYVGILALEMFVKDGAVIANEMAPRVHNSGHWSIDGAPCSQFENHLRAILDLPLGSTAPHRPAGMVNLIGSLPTLPPLLAMDDVHVHLYGKEPRPGRKIGHVNTVNGTILALQARIREINIACAATSL